MNTKILLWLLAAGGGYVVYKHLSTSGVVTAQPAGVNATGVAAAPGTTYPYTAAQPSNAQASQPWYQQALNFVTGSKPATATTQANGQPANNIAVGASVASSLSSTWANLDSGSGGGDPGDSYSLDTADDDADTDWSSSFDTSP